MPVLRRIVFGEPKPGGQQLANLLLKLQEGASYCNRTGPLQHDRVTDVPFTVPALGFDFVHPTSLIIDKIQQAPITNDEYGIFSWHHMSLYYEGAKRGALDSVHVEAARLCQAIYAYPGDEPEPWDVRNETYGVSWGIRYRGERAYVVFRGSLTLLDWVEDLFGFNPEAILKHDTFGLVWAGFDLGMADTWAVIKPLLARYQEVVFTGHSLGAARAGVTAAYAVA